MAVDLLDSNEAFRAQMQRCEKALRVHTGWSVTGVLRADEGAPPLEGTDVIQPVLFAVMVSLAALWRSLGVEPAAVVGHSQGEIAAACVAGALSLEDAAKIVALRSRALVKLSGTGGMLAVSLPAGQAARPAGAVAGPDLDRGAQQPRRPASSPATWTRWTRSPPPTASAVQIRRIVVDYASHTPHVEALREELLATLDGVAPRATDIAFSSAHRGEFIDTAELTTAYWYESLRNPVLIESAVTAFAGAGTPLFIEASPHPVLGHDLREICESAGITAGVAATLRRGAGDWRRFLTALADAYVLGAEVDWSAAVTPGPIATWTCRRTPSSAAATGWAHGPAGIAPAGIDASGHPLLTAVVPTADDGLLLTGELSAATAPWLADHAVDGGVLLPGAAFVELALEGGALTDCDRLEELVIEAPLFLSEGDAAPIQVIVGSPDADGRRSVGVFARAGVTWTRHASGLLATGSPAG